MSSSARLSRSATILVHAPFERAFRLFDVTGQTKWLDGWEPRLVVPDSDAPMEKTVFTTTTLWSDTENCTWIVSRYLPHELCLEYTVTTACRVGFISIRCSRTIDNNTEAEITCVLIGLDERGKRRNAATLDRLYALELRDYEEAINYYLATGGKLSAAARRHIAPATA